MATRWEPYTLPEGELTALLARGDGVEVTPCLRAGDDCEPCQDGEESMWSVYIHVQGEGTTCIGDWIVDDQDPHGIAHAPAAAFTEAYAMADKLLDLHPHLRVFGIQCDCC